MKNYVKTIARKREFGIVIMVFVLATLLTCMSDAFLQWDNIKDFLRSNAVIGIMAFGMLPVLTSGGIDLSVSATIALSAGVDGVSIRELRKVFSEKKLQLIEAIKQGRNLTDMTLEEMDAVWNEAKKKGL